MLLLQSKKLRQISAVLETGNFLFLKLLLKNPSKARWYPGRIFRTYMRLVGEERWRCAGVSELFPEQDHQRIIIEHVNGENTENYLHWLACLGFVTQSLSPKLIFEIGTFQGRTALNFALNTREDAKVVTLDLPPEQRENRAKTALPGDARLMMASEPDREYRGRDVAHKIEQIYGDSTRFDFSPWHGRVDLVFIDGGHDYATAKSDTHNALSMLAPGGAILWDNFAQYGEFNDVTRAVLDCLPGNEITQIEDTELALYRSRVK